MERRTKKEIKEAIDKLKEKPGGQSSLPQPHLGKLSAAKSSKRIRKQGV